MEQGYRIRRYSKMWVALFGTLGLVLLCHEDAGLLAMAVLAAVTVFAVYQVPNIRS